MKKVVKNQLITISTLPSNLYAKGNIVKCSLYGLLKIVKVIDGYTIKVKKLNWFLKATYYIRRYFSQLYRSIRRR